MQTTRPAGAGQRRRPNFTGSDRFELVRCLGEGGFGAVYETVDHQEKRKIALKVLSRAQPDALLRFKQEFRFLADIRHPGLVRLLGLHNEGDTWLLSMELIHGVPFDRFLSRNPDRREACCAQLATALSALHASGKLHRDIKPSNVLVESNGRVVVLDFGLTRSLEDEASTQLAGTPLFMSPEQCSGAGLSEASDWYALGVMLYQSLAGRLPFEGTLNEVLRAKEISEPRPLEELAPETPRELASLCMRLLAREPSQRPTSEELLSYFELPKIEVPRSTSLVGRESELIVLRDAHQALRDGHAKTVLVSGASGIGKTALVQNFLEELESDSKTLVFQARCYQQESIRYEAFDAIIDALTRYLSRLPSAEAAVLLPRDIAALSQVFRALNSAEVVAEASVALPAVADPAERLRRAMSALVELLARLADRCALVVAIDDLQWADEDSATLLGEMLGASHPPTMLLVGCFRQEDEETSPFLQSLFGMEAMNEAERIVLEPLNSDQALDLARAITGRTDESSARWLAEASEGSPFFLSEIARFIEDDSIQTIRSLSDLVLERISAFGADQRVLLDFVAVAGRPLEVDHAQAVSKLGSSFGDCQRDLCEAHLLRVVTLGEAPALACYHDRIREVLCNSLDESRRLHLHGSLAEAMQRAGCLDSERLSHHFLEAKRHDEAAAFALRAAEEAFERLAFHRSAIMFKRALDLKKSRGAERSRLLTKMGDALVNSYRSRDAAEAYLEAANAAGLERLTVLKLKTSAALQLLGSGHRQGVDVVREVLDEVGMQMPSTDARSLSALALRRARLRIRGFSYSERPAVEVPSDILLKLDSMWAVTTALSFLDPGLGFVDFNTQSLLLALDAGEPTRIARALPIEAFLRGLAGDRGLLEGRELFEKAESIARKDGNPRLLGLVSHFRGAVAYFGEAALRSAFEHFSRATQLYLEECVGATWELATSRGLKMQCLSNLGRFDDLSECLPQLLQDATARKDYVAELNLCRPMNTLKLAEGDVAGARAVSENIRKGDFYPENPYGFNFSTYFFNRCEQFLYAADGEAGWEYLNANRVQLRRCLAFKTGFMACFKEWVLGRCATLAAHQCRGLRRKKRLVEAKVLARVVTGRSSRIAGTAASALRASISLVERRHQDAVIHLEKAARGFAELEMSDYVAAARLRLAELSGSAIQVSQAETALVEMGIAEPRNWARMVIPGPV